MLSERELQARYEVFLEQYVTTINIEGETAASIARDDAAARRDRPGRRRSGWPVTARASTRLKAEADGLVDEFVESDLRARGGQRRPPRDRGRPLESAKYVQGTVMPAMAAAREVADKLEKVVPDELWPLPKYSEILFIK